MKRKCFRRFGSGTLTALTVALGLTLGLSGCGDDAPAGNRSKPARKAGGKKKKKGKNAGKGQELQFYDKIEDFAQDGDEAGSIRHKFMARDFEPDTTGMENRDPFRSYVIRQPGITQQDTGRTGDVEETKVCSSKNMVATNYSLRDLRLIGIVLRGTRSYALFRDSASYGHIVHKGDCMGQEKARVSAIGSGFVSLEIMPDIPGSDEPQRPQERSIQLYPEELQIDPENQPETEE